MPLTLPVPANVSDELPRAWAETALWFRELLADEEVVGGALWFFHEGRPLARELYGFADLGSGRRVDEYTIFHWGSITKTLTGIAVMQLRDRGLVCLDDPLVRYLPELGDVHNPFGETAAITLRHAMTHSAGFRAATWPFGGDQPWHPFEPTRWEQLVAMFPYTQVGFEPGSRFGYSNLAIVFLGRILELLSGDDYETYVDKHILRPLEMHRSYFDLTPPHLAKHRSNNYIVEDGTPRANGLDFDTGVTVSNGGLNASIPDLGRYAAFLMGHSDRREEHVKVLKRSSLEEMWRPAFPAVDPVAGTGTAFVESMGLVFFVVELGARTLVGHTGSQKAFRAFLYVDPGARTAAIAAFNSEGADSSGGLRPDARRVLVSVRERLFADVFPLFHAP